MPRPSHEQPTPAELEVLKILWQRGPSTVRDVWLALGQRGAYTSMMSLLTVMYEKGQVTRQPEGRAFRYAAGAPQEETQGGMVSDLLRRAFEGSASTLVSRLLEQAEPDADELREIRRAITRYLDEQKGKQQ